MTDLVFPVGKGSLWGDLEIRYALRSMEKHLTDFGNVWIIGYCPDFLKNVNHISYPDDQRCKEANIYRKVLRACQQEDISEDFLFCNDDHFLLADFVTSQFPFYYRTNLASYAMRFKRGNRYRMAIVNAYRALKGKGYSLNSFDLHCPILFNKKKYLDVMPRYDWDQKVTFIMKSMYANSIVIEGEKIADCKINAQISSDEIRAIIKGRKFFSMGNGAIGSAMREVLDELYPTPSKYEK